MIRSESPIGVDGNGKNAPIDALAATVPNTYHMLNSTDPDKRHRVCVFLDTALPETLMRNDLNSAERMAIQWKIATLVSLFTWGLMSD